MLSPKAKAIGDRPAFPSAPGAMHAGMTFRQYLLAKVFVADLHGHFANAAHDVDAFLECMAAEEP